ncbi:MAG: sterol desaturase family protein [Woeseia sp.]
MALETVEQARAVYRERHISEQYSGPLHLATTVGVSMLIALLAAMLLEDVSRLEWLTIPLTFLYANLIEYVGHRGPMHRKTRFLGPVFERHAIQHHTFFTDESATVDTTQDFKAVLFPPIMLLFFHGCFALPVGALLFFIVSPNVCYLFVITAMLYFLNYELLHLAYHIDPKTSVGRLPFMYRLRRHHIRHHNRNLMTSYNFNITYPLCDYLFGTVYRERD